MIVLDALPTPTDAAARIPWNGDDLPACPAHDDEGNFVVLFDSDFRDGWSAQNLTDDQGIKALADQIPAVVENRSPAVNRWRGMRVFLLRPSDFPGS